jgi:ribose transport system ATP-binding protein
MNFQEMSRIPALTVAQNVFLTREVHDAHGLIDDDSIRRAEAIFNMLEFEVSPRALVGDLGARQKQMTEIAKAISQDARVLILDEPSTALAVSDVERLFVFLRTLGAQGVAISYVSHRMDEIARIADRATILRDGRHVITTPMADLPIDTMIEHIVGKRSKGLADVARGGSARGEALLELKAVTGPHKPDNVSFTPRRGEGLGLAGLLGLGISALARVIAGIEPAAAGEIRIKGKPVQIRRPADSIAEGVALVPDARATQGIIPANSVSENMVMAVLGRITKSGLVGHTRAREIADQMIQHLSVKTASRDHAVFTLSGGNQQKVVIGKWLAADPDIVILDEPTAGIDIGSKSEIMRLVRDLALTGKGVLVISSEPSELLTACDRILVMADGRAHQMLDRADMDDPAETNPDHALQAAERRLQIEIQKALTAKEATHG